jgi:hypothetical protein
VVRSNEQHGRVKQSNRRPQRGGTTTGRGPSAPNSEHSHRIMLSKHSNRTTNTRIKAKEPNRLSPSVRRNTPIESMNGAQPKGERRSSHSNPPTQDPQTHRVILERLSSHPLGPIEPLNHCKGATAYIPTITDW